MDTVVIDRLIEVLNKETAIYEGILKLSKNKTEIIVEGKVSELESLTRLEQSIILQLGKLESEREELVEKLAAQLNMKAADITLEGLRRQFPGEHAEKMEKCSQALPKLLGELSEANVLNSKLLRNSLDYIDFSINILTSAGSVGNNYGYSGESNNTGKRNFFDMKL